MIEQTEKWKPVVGYEEFYEVSDQGRVRLLVSRAMCVKAGRFCSQENNYGYKRVSLTDAHGVRRHFRVHRLVAMAFISNPHSYPFINHLNGKKDDNHVENLEWCNHSMNRRHAEANGFGQTGSIRTWYRALHPTKEMRIYVGRNAARDAQRYAGPLGKVIRDKTKGVRISNHPQIRRKSHE